MTVAKLHLIIKKMIPGWIYNFLFGKWDSQGFKKYFSNTNWIFLSHIVNFISSFLIFSIVARYLGPENLGKLNYAQSFVAIFSMFASLGIDQILQRDLIRNPEQENELIGTAIFSKLFFGVITFIALIFSAFTFNDDFILILLIGIIGLTFIINPFSTLGVLFDSKVASKYNSYLRISVAILIPLIKILIIIFNKGIIYLAATLLLESLMGGIILIYIYKKAYHKSITEWKFSFEILKRLLKDSWPLMLAGLSAVIYSRIDQVMIQHLLNSASVGLYAGAVKITSIVQTFPGIIIASLFPAIVNAKKVDHQKYLDRIKSLVIFATTLVIFMVVPIVIFSSLIVKIVLGAEFVESSHILQIHVLSALGIVIVSIIQNYLITENLGKIFFVATVVGATVNSVLNIILINMIGVVGAAYATVISYIVTIVCIFIFKKPFSDLIESLKFK